MAAARRAPVARQDGAGADGRTPARMRRCERGGSWLADGVTFTFLHPAAGAPASGGDRNANSCVLRVEGAHHSLLLTGDIGVARAGAGRPWAAAHRYRAGAAPWLGVVVRARAGGGGAGRPCDCAERLPESLRASGAGGGAALAPRRRGVLAQRSRRRGDGRIARRRPRCMGPAGAPPALLARTLSRRRPTGARRRTGRPGAQAPVSLTPHHCAMNNAMVLVISRSDSRCTRSSKPWMSSDFGP